MGTMWVFVDGLWVLLGTVTSSTSETMTFQFPEIPQPEVDVRDSNEISELEKIFRLSDPRP